MSADDLARVASAVVVERQPAAALLRVRVDVEPTGDTGVEYRVTLADLRASSRLDLRMLVGVVEAGVGRDDAGNRWRGIPRARTAREFSFVLAAVDHGRSEAPGPPPRSGARGFCFVVTAPTNPPTPKA